MSESKSNRRSIRCLVISVCLLGMFGSAATMLPGAVNSASAAPSGAAYRLRETQISKARESAATDSAVDEEALTRPGREAADDPLAFLEGEVRCNDVLRGLSRRYGRQATHGKISAALLEEYRHVYKLTCGSSRFASCHFRFCGDSGIQTARAETSKREETTEEAAAEETTATARVSANRKSTSRTEANAALSGRARLAPAVDSSSVDGASESTAAEVAAPERTIEREVPVRAAALREPSEAAIARSMDRSSDSKNADAKIAINNTDAPARSEASLRRERGHSVREELPLIPIDRALVKLGEMRKDREQRLAQLISTKKAEESRLGVSWKKFTVPGGERPPRVRLSAADAQALMEAQALEAQGQAADQIGPVDNHIAQAQAQGGIPQANVPASMPISGAYGGGYGRGAGNYIPNRGMAGPNGVAALPGGAQFQRQLPPGSNAYVAREQSVAERNRTNDPSLSQAQNQFFQMFTNATTSKMPRRSPPPAPPAGGGTGAQP